METTSNKRSCRDGNRRMACDRCRAQKLRCIMTDPSSDWCTRCKNANVSCKRGPAGRSGRPRTRRLNLDQGRSTVQHDLEDSARGSRNNQAFNQIWHGGIASKDHVDSTVPTFTGNSASVPVNHFSLHQNERLGHLASVRYFDDICSERGFDDPARHYNEPFRMERSLAQGSTSSLEGFPQDTDDDLPHDPTPVACAKDDSFLMLSPAYTMQQTGSNFGTRSDLSFLQARPDRPSNPSNLVQAPSDSAYETDERSTADIDMKNTPIEVYQKLAQLATQMQSEIAAVSKVDPARCQDTHVAPSLLDVASSVLESSTKVYDTILSSFWDDRSRITILQTINRPQPDRPPTVNNETLQGDKLDKPSRALPTPSFKPDIAMCLQLLASYFQVLELHEIFYRKLCEYFGHHCLSRHEQTDPKSPASLMSPVVGFGQYSLTNFPELQWGLLLQTSLYLLGRIEILLGLPQDCRTGSASYRGSRTESDSLEEGQRQKTDNANCKDAGAHHRCSSGILGLSISSSLIRAAFREHMLKTGEDKIIRIQKLIDSLQSNVIIPIRN